MQARNSFILLSLVILPLALCATPPQLADNSEISITQQGTVRIIGGKMQSIAMNLSMPLPSAYQIVDYGGATIKDEEGNSYIRIDEQESTSTFAYSERIGVESFARHTLSLPGSYAVPAAYSLYLQPSENTESGDPRIKKLALEAVEGSRDPFDRIAKLAIFVNNYLEYDPSLVGQEKSALWALESRRGVCTEYSALYAALARSIGIPTRYVSGYAQSESLEGFVGHAWNEAYIGQWVPVDATWFEVGNLDAMHIEEAKYAENRKRNTLSASVSSPSATVDWDTPGQGGASAGYVSLKSASYSKPRSDFELSAARTILAPGESTVVYMALPGKEYMAMQASLATCSGASIVSIPEPEKFAILRPGEETLVAWEITAEKSLAKGYTYTCPLTLNSPYLEHKAITITIDPEKAQGKSFLASLSSPSSSQGIPNSILISSPSQLSGSKFYAFLPDGAEEKAISGKSGEIPFQSPWPGKHKIIVASSTGGVQELLLLVTPQDQALSIGPITLSGALEQGKPASAAATISSSSYPLDITMVFSSCGGTQSTSARLSAPAAFRFDFTPQAAGACTLLLEAKEASSGSTAQKGAVADVSPASQLPSQQVGLPSQETGLPQQSPQPCAMPLAILALAAVAGLAWAKR